MRWHRPRSLRTIVLALGLVLAVLSLGLLAWFGATRWLVRSGKVAQWLGVRPDRFSVAFADLSSPFPGVLVVRGLDLRIQTPRLRWQIQAERAWGVIDPLSLLARRLRFVTVRAHGASVRGYRIAVETPADAAPGTSGANRALPRTPPTSPNAGSTPPTERTALRMAAMPPIPPFPEPARPPRAAFLPWSWEFPDVRLEATRELWLEEMRWTGGIDGQGGFALRRRREAEIFPSRLELADAHVEIAGHDAGTVSGTLRVAVEAWQYRGADARTVLPRLDAQLVARGTFETGPIARHFLRDVPWLELSGPPAPFVAALLVEQGHLRPGSTARFRPASQEVRVFDIGLVGSGQIALDARRDALGERCDVTLRLDRFAARGRDGAVLLGGDGLHAELLTRDLTLAGRPGDLALAFDLGRAEVPDLARLDDLLPSGGLLRLSGGSGTVTGSGTASNLPHSAHGIIETRFDDVVVAYGRARLRGVVRGTLRLADGDLDSRRFSIAGSELAAERFGMTAPSGNESGWWARLRVPAADLELGPARRVRGDFELELRDTRPLVAMIDQRRDLPRWMERALDFENARAGGRFAWRAGELALPSFVSRREHSAARGSVTLRQHELAARVLLTWKTLQAGVEIAGRKRRLHVRDAAAWFADAAAAAAPPAER